MAEDGNVDRVGSGGRVVSAFHTLQESINYGMELSCAAEEAGIRAVQVGKPLANGGEGVANCVSPDRFVLLPCPSIAEAEDEEVGKAFFRVQRIEGAGLAMLLAERSPDPEDFAGGFTSLGGCGSGGEVESSAKVSGEEMLVGRGSSFQGMGCG